jgi:acyl-coenzyme A thioesterase PaaI-like protein
MLRGEQFKHYNPLGSVHGGWYATLLDSALGCSVRQLATAEGRIVGRDDRLYAHGTTTCLVFEVPTR